MNETKNVSDITDKIAKQEKVVEKVANDLRVNKDSSVKLSQTDEWKAFEKTALLKKLIDEEITFLDLRLQRMELKCRG